MNKIEAERNLQTVEEKTKNPHYWRETHRKELIKNLFKWMKKESSIVLTEFRYQEGLTYRTILYLKNNFNDFADAYEIAKSYLAAKLVKGMCKKDGINWSIFNTYIHHYDTELAHFRREEQQNQSNSMGQFLSQIKSKDYKDAQISEPFNTMYKNEVNKSGD